MRNRSSAPALLLTLLASLLAPLRIHAQQTAEPIPTMRMAVNLVHVMVNVTDANGAPVGGLNREDFALTEDDRPQQIAIFEKQSGQPLNLTLAIDTSGSVRKDLDLESAASRKFIHSLLRTQDQMSLIQFATDVREVTPFTNKANLLERGLNQLKPDFATALYDAVLLASEKLGKKDGRKILILVSDGGDTAQNTTYAQALEAALRNEVMIYSLIDVPIAASAGRDTGGEHALITLAEQTGGKSFYVADGGLDQAFAHVSDDLRTQYMLAYYPHHPVPGKDFHRILVTVPRAAAGQFHVLHRTGYYTAAQAQESEN